MVKKTFGFIKNVSRALKEKRLATVAGAWVYYFLLSAVPFFFLLVSAFGLFGLDFAKELAERLPEEFSVAFTHILGAAEDVSKGVTVFFVLTVIFSCSTLLSRMSDDGDHIYGESKRRGIMRRVWALVAVAVFFSVFLFAAFLFAFGNRFLPHAGNSRYKATVLTFFIFSIVIFLSYVIIILLNKFICPKEISFSTAATGSLVSLFTIVMGTIGFILYLKLNNGYNAFYGSLAAVVIFLLWCYIVMLGLVLGVIVNSYLVEKQGEKVYAGNQKSDQNLRRRRESRRRSDLDRKGR